MASKGAKEASTALIVSLVFFVLTTIAFGVMWYMQYSAQEADKAAVAEANKKATAATAQAKEAEHLAKLYRGWLGIAEGDDLATLTADHKPGDKVSTELKRINDLTAKAAGYADPSTMPAALVVWPVDGSGKIGDPPATPAIKMFATLAAQRDQAQAKEKAVGDTFNTAVADFRKAIKTFDDMTGDLKKLVDTLPKEFDKKLNEEVAKYTARANEFSKKQAESLEKLNKLSDQKDDVSNKLLDSQNRNKFLQEANQVFQRKAGAGKDVLANDEPQGKVLRRIGDIVEINLGSDDLVKNGLTFTALPYDFPEKGRQSRVQEFRIPDNKGVYQSVPRFVPKATLEVIEVLGPHLSRARITDEFEKIRDGVTQGDLLYNAAWRKGTTDHIALVGIFDVNGDGTDDIERVIADLAKMGIPVDAYFNLKTRKWQGQIGEQTRYVVKGQFPVISGVDPNRDDKSVLTSLLNHAVKTDAQEKGIDVINYQEFFGRMGYRVKRDISNDKINQATAPFLNRVGVQGAPIPNPQ